METIINIVISTIAVILTAYILPWVAVSGFFSAFLVAIVLWIVNYFIRPLVILLTLPINILTVGLFTFVINALLILLVSVIVPGFKIDGFWWALLFGIILSIVNSVLYIVFK